ncbi:PstS family phosphate ABC transporter substrate-binding protein [Geovibrio thiophilus]|uniref:PstS family phosphate ABC transporter substrate-binding protein n=1 Tax=Geovibrio thiophilus TaxID=139438 RepID=A0A3R5Y7P0_9BACT|nr:PstS family phosphate ABC transporter substrate-binding protein [Geovibrio thiophilus]QAR33702.1 PstS family phosphate ABC transporter substrate-binding protein [Geovibrio thiophilus]
MKKTMKLIAIALLMTALTAGFAFARDQIRIVGSSTVFPFSSYVAEEFGATTKSPTPVVESVGSGGGHKLFAAGVGLDTADITNSSRRIKKSELEADLKAGITQVIEIKIGYDGIAIAHNKSGADFSLTLAQLALAVAEEVPVNGQLVKNPYKKWSDIDKSLPNADILVYGPPTSSGTRDAFEELVMEGATGKIKEYGKPYKKIRQDGVYVPSGENDNLIVQRLVKDKNAIGIFGYSFLQENADRIKGVAVNGVLPSPENVLNSSYPISRSLFFYVKGDHLGKVKGMEQYVDLFLSEKMIGEGGFLTEIGLIPLSKTEREKVRADWKARKALSLNDVK